MNKSLLPTLFIVLLFGLPLVLAEEGGVAGNGGVPLSDIPPEPDYISPILSNPNGSFLFLTLSLFSIILGVFVTRFFIKKSRKQPDLIKISLSIVTGILILIILAKWIYTFGTNFSNIFVGVLLILSLGLLITLFLKKEFQEKMRYTLSLYTGGILISLLVLLSSIIRYGLYPPNPGYVSLIDQDLIIVAGTILTGVLLVVGFIIDKKKN
jgi:hypothetical protein